MVKIRLTRMGRKNLPFYRIVVIDSRKARDSQYIEKIGHYDPLWKNKTNTEIGFINKERFLYWTSVGAQATKVVKRLAKTLLK